MLSVFVIVRLGPEGVVTSSWPSELTCGLSTKLQCPRWERGLLSPYFFCFANNSGFGQPLTRMSQLPPNGWCFSREITESCGCSPRLIFPSVCRTKFLYPETVFKRMYTPNKPAGREWKATKTPTKRQGEEIFFHWPEPTWAMWELRRLFKSRGCFQPRQMCSLGLSDKVIIIKCMIMMMNVTLSEAWTNCFFDLILFCSSVL